MTQTFQVSNGDWVLDKRTGRPTLISGRTKLRQDIRELLSIETQPNGFGAGLDDLIGQDVDPAGFKTEVQRAIRNAVLAMQRLQDQFLASRRAASERVAAISSLTVSAVNLGGGTTKTGYSFRLTVRPVAGEAVTVAGTGS